MNEQRKNDVWVKVTSLINGLILLAVSSGVGLLWTLKNQVSEIHTFTLLTNKDVEHNTELIRHHISKKNAHQ